MFMTPGQTRSFVSQVAFGSRTLSRCRAVFLGSIAPVVLSTALPLAGVAAAEWEEIRGGRRLAVEPKGEAYPGFRRIDADASGIVFTNHLSDTSVMINMNLMNGSGVGLGDFDGDGLSDIYFCNLEGPNKLYRNMGGFQFEDVTDQFGVAVPETKSTGAVFADVDGDRRMDLITTSMGGPNHLFMNRANGSFEDVAQSVGLDSRLGSNSIALADTDGDGDLDLYIANYGATSVLRSGGNLNVVRRNGKLTVRGRYADRIKFRDGRMFEYGEEDYYYLNNGDGSFSRQSWEDDTFVDIHGNPFDEVPIDQGLSIVFRDLDLDGDPDLYICNDAFMEDRCFINDGAGKFRQIAPEAIRKTSFFTMGVDFSDINRDGFDDFMLVDMLSPNHELQMTQKSNPEFSVIPIGDSRKQDAVRRNTLFLNRGDGTYAEIGNLAGIEATDWTWETIFVDVDLDGWEDVLITNGFERNIDDQDTREKIQAMGKLSISESRKGIFLYPRLLTPNVAFRNNRDLTFSRVSEEWGFASEAISNGMALADLDNDGDQDVVVNVMNGPAEVYENIGTAPRIGVRLKGRAPNTQGIGARITVLGGPVRQTQEMMSGGRYVSGDDGIRTFAASDKAGTMTIEVKWRDGTVSTLRNLDPNHVYEIDQAGAVVPPDAPVAAKAAPILTEVSDRLNHRHHEKEYDDFTDQLLLNRKLSQQGPGVLWFDLDADGRQELFVGAGRGGKVAGFSFTGDDVGRLEANASVAGDTIGLAGWNPGTGRRVLLAGESDWEAREGAVGVLVGYALADGGKLVRSVLVEGSVGALAVADIDGDGDEDVFAAGTPRPGRYPVSSPHRILINDDGRLREAMTVKAAVGGEGIVNAAVFADLDGDGDADLLLATEWGPVRAFTNDGGVLTDATSALGLDAFHGMWLGLATGDFDGDGRIDLVATNWGLNDRHTAFATHPLSMFHGDDGSGVHQYIEAWTEPGSGRLLPRRDFIAMSQITPRLRAQFQTHRAYAESNLNAMYGDSLDALNEASLNELRSMAFLHRGGRFEPVPLPIEAQFAPSHAPVVGDFDGDGHVDLFLSQNFFPVRPDPDFSQLDAGRGLLLLGDGSGEFAPVDGSRSGIFIYGDQRGAAAADFDGDGRLDLAVGQNAGPTILLRNTGH